MASMYVVGIRFGEENGVSVGECDSVVKRDDGSYGIGIYDARSCEMT